MTMIKDGREEQRTVQPGNWFETVNITDEDWAKITTVMFQGWLRGEAGQITMFGKNFTLRFESTDVVRFDFWPGSEEPS
jgi:hypothetical protein